MALLSSMALQTTMGKPPLKYLGVINDGSKNQGNLEYSTDAVLSKCAKFDVETAHGGLIHIRSSLTNKYWVRSSTNGNWIVAKGLKPDADMKSWTCTLFRMEVDDNKRVKFYHVQSGCILRVPNNGKMLTIDPAASTIALSCVVDYDTLVVLPKYVAFKGSNGLFFNNSLGTQSMSFSLTEVGDPDAVCEIKYTNDGRIRLKIDTSSSISNSSFYWANHFDTRYAIIGASLGSDNVPSTRELFEAIKVDNNKIALRSVANNKLCMRVDDKYTKSYPYLEARATGVTRDAILEIVEPVFRRTVKLYEFDLDNARIYNVRLLYSVEHTWDNTTNETHNSSADGTIKTTKSYSYNNSVTVSGTVEAKIEAGIPFLAGGSVKVSASMGYCHGWGNTVEESQQVGHAFNVAMKPMRTTRARGVATMGTCDVPFSYVQKDYPISGGPPIITKLYDGVFTGANAYSFHTQIWDEQLPPYNGPPHLPRPKMCVKRPMVAPRK